MTANAAAKGDTAPPGSHQVLTFTLGAETYGVDILRVQEIRGWSPVTRIPQSPSHVLGVLNLRGSIVPIVDLRMRFSLDQAEYTAVTVIIVLSVESAAGRRDIGALRLRLSAVKNVSARDLPNIPPLLSGTKEPRIVLELDYWALFPRRL